MMRFKIKIAISLILAAESCITIKDISGKYASHGSENSIKLNPDSSFKYEFGAGHMYATSSGRWHRTGRRQLRLSSNITNTVIPLKVSVDKSEAINTISINIRTLDSVPIENYRCRIYLDNELYAVKRADSLTQLGITKKPQNIYLVFTHNPLIFSSFSISPAVVSEKQNIDKTSGYVAIQVDLDLPMSFFYYRPFDNEFLKLRRNAVGFYNSFQKEWQFVPRVADSVNIFIRE